MQITWSKIVQVFCQRKFQLGAFCTNKFSKFAEMLWTCYIKLAGKFPVFIVLDTFRHLIYNTWSWLFPEKKEKENADPESLYWKQTYSTFHLTTMQWNRSTLSPTKSIGKYRTQSENKFQKSVVTGFYKQKDIIQYVC